MSVCSFVDRSPSSKQEAGSKESGFDLFAYIFLLNSGMLQVSPVATQTFGLITARKSDLPKTFQFSEDQQFGI